MKRFSVLLCSILLAFGNLGTVDALVIDFDLITTESVAVIPSDYQGFSWGDQWSVVSDAVYAAYDNNYGSPSGEYAAFNPNGLMTMSLSSGDDFDFDGAYFTGWAINNVFDSSISSTSVTIEGYKDDLLVDLVTTVLSFNRYDWVNVNFLGVDKLVFISSANEKYWLMDDFTYNSGSAPAPVPEPATMLLFGIGLIGLTGLCRRKFKKYVS